MTIRIFGVALSPYTRKVKMALNVKGLDYEVTPTSTADAINEMMQYNPRGEVPTVLDGDVVLTDSTIALQHIEEQYPEPPLLPADPALRARARQLEDLGDRLGDAIIFAMAEVHMNGHTEVAEQVTAGAKAELADLYEYLDKQLGDNEYLCGDNITWADLALLPGVSGAQFFQMGPGDDFPRVQAWLERCLALPPIAKDFAEVMEAAASGLRAAELPAGHPHNGRNYRAERAEFFLRNGMAEYLGKGIAAGTIRVGISLNAALV